MSPDAVLSPRVLILASRYDLTCDYVISSLRAGGLPYFRLNTEDLPLFELTLDPVTPLLRGISSQLTFEIRGEHLASVYFRQPTFLREASLSGRPGREQFQRAQWAAFVRNLSVFDGCLWVNHPSHTYEAEHKAVQLRAAAQVGFEIPRTSICNSAGPLEWVVGASDCVAVKGLDTVLVREGRLETFGYTNLLRPAEIGMHDIRSAPMILQQAIDPKLDLRVTVVGDLAWCVAVMVQGQRISGDWRLAKTDAEFTEFDLPLVIVQQCISLTRRLGLQFGAIDLALSNGQFYFLEINPTGEWAWLEAGLGIPIADALARLLSRGTSDAPGSGTRPL
jgi:glutathione synthase/RimK-type ligase-like ATP-grasp enzyme